MKILWFRVGAYERALLFRGGALTEVLGPGLYLRAAVFEQLEVETFSERWPFINSERLDVIARSGLLAAETRLLELGDRERAIVRVDGRLTRVLGPGRTMLWTGFAKVEVEMVDVGAIRLERSDLKPLLALEGARSWIEEVVVPQGSIGLVYLGGEVREVLQAGAYAFWRGVAHLEVKTVDTRLQVLEVAGQDLLTADLVSVRLNATAMVRISDPVRALAAAESATQALYREAQLVVRAVVGARTLDQLLASKVEVAGELDTALRAKAALLGIEIESFGIRDIVLPGEMKAIMNRVTEARKAAEANLVTRREETAAMRSQLNTARLLEGNPTLMRLRELEVLEKVAEKTNLQVLLGEGRLTERIVKMI